MFSESEDSCFKKGCPKNDDHFCYSHDNDASPKFAYCAHCSLIPPNGTCANFGEGLKSLSKEGLKDCKAKCETGTLEIS